MWKAAIVGGGALFLLAGCASVEQASASCTEAGLSEADPAYNDCVKTRYNRQAATDRTMRNILTGFGAAGRNAQPTTTPVTTPGPSRFDRGSGRFLRSQHVDGFNRICIYNTIHGEVAETIPSTQLCSLD